DQGEARQPPEAAVLGRSGSRCHPVPHRMVVIIHPPPCRDSAHYTSLAWRLPVSNTRGTREHANLSVQQQIQQIASVLSQFPPTRLPRHEVPARIFPILRLVHGNQVIPALLVQFRSGPRNQFDWNSV